MLCRSRRNILLILCLLGATVVMIDEFLQQFKITKRSKNRQEHILKLSSDRMVLTSEVSAIRDVGSKSLGWVGNNKEFMEMAVAESVNKQLVNQTATQQHEPMSFENMTRQESQIVGKITDAKTDSGGPGDSRNLSQFSEAGDKSVKLLIERKEKDDVGTNSDTGTKAGASTKAEAGTVAGAGTKAEAGTVADVGTKADASTELVKVNTTAANVNYVDQYGEDRDRLMTSPYIYNERVEKKRLSFTNVQRSVKKVAGYMPYESNWVHKSFRGCQYDKCQFIINMSEADAVIFGGGRVRDHVIPYFYRPPGQRWILYTFDPAINNYALDRPDAISSFNWTMSYQLDSDYPFLFGRLVRRDLPAKDYDKIYDGKVNQTAWFVSHCHTWSKREIYVERMKKIIPVEIFGGCSDRRCGAIHYRTHDSTLCLPMLSKSYKFYLAFENSFCKDYVTEKFFKLFDDVDVIPVVRGGFNYKKYLPSGIFVDADDFKTPEALANYLLLLGNNKVEYVKMLKRKNRWVTASTQNFHCNICKALHTSENTTQYIPNLKIKFNGDPPYCWQPRDLGPPD